MDHLLLPLERLRHEVDFFAREESLRLFHVVVDTALHGPALDVVRAMEWSPGNKRVVFVLEDPADAQTTRWITWSNRVLAEFENVREAYAKTGIKIGEVVPPSEGEPLICFASILKSSSEILSRSPCSTAGIAVIFCTAALDEPDQWLAVLDEMLNRTPSLAHVRWGWMETGAAVGNEFLRRLGPEVALHAECRIDPIRQQQDLEDMLSAMAEASDGATGPMAAGGAAPTVAPPPHPTDPSKGTTPSPAGQVNRLFLQALQAGKAGDMREAMRLQSLSIQHCLSVENLPLAVEMELLLATYAVQAAAGDRVALRAALTIFQRASERAYQAGLVVAGAKADIVLAPLAKLAGEFELVGQALRRAADKARAAAPALSIEALRMAAEVILETGNPPRAAELLAEAVDVAVGLPPAEAKNTSAPKCADALATLLRGQGQDLEALEMDALAKRLAAGTP